MRRHLGRCPACSGQGRDEQALRELIRSSAADRPDEVAAAERLGRYWLESIPEAPVRAAAPVRPVRRRWVTASAAAMVAVAGVLMGSLTAPGRAVASVRAAMARVNRFHVKMELPTLRTHYEAWGGRKAGARIEEWQGDQRTLIIVDNGRKLKIFHPESGVMALQPTRFRPIFERVRGFQAGKLLRTAAQGELFEGQEEWLGTFSPRGVQSVVREGRAEKAIRIDLKGGFFEKMLVYADAGSERLAQVNLYTDNRHPEDRPFARVYFDYPDRLDPDLFKLQAPPGMRVHLGDTDFVLP